MVIIVVFGNDSGCVGKVGWRGDDGGVVVCFSVEFLGLWWLVYGLEYFWLYKRILGDNIF